MRLIDGDVLLEQFKTLRDKWDTKNATHRAVRGAFVDCILRVKDAPTVNADPVTRGEWLDTRDSNKKLCSNCRVIHFITQYPCGGINYCPNCGAKMITRRHGE